MTVTHLVVVASIAASRKVGLLGLLGVALPLACTTPRSAPAPLQLELSRYKSLARRSRLRCTVSGRFAGVASALTAVTRC